LLKSFWSWHMTYARLNKLWTIPLLTWCGWLPLKSRQRPVRVGFRYTSVVSFGPRCITKTFKSGTVSLASSSIVNLREA
jgi:hypothetical protein